MRNLLLASYSSAEKCLKCLDKRSALWFNRHILMSIFNDSNILTGGRTSVFEVDKLLSKFS